MSKASKRRPCPAVQREITPSECGENRVSKYVCPAECPFNPFGSDSYDEALALDELVSEKSILRLFKTDPERVPIERDVEKSRRHPSPHAFSAVTFWQFHFRRDTAGLTFMERWARAGFPELKNDGRVFAQAKASMHITLLEVHRVLDHEQVEVIDLLDAEPVPFVVRDRSMAASAARFSSTMSWMFRLPHYAKTVGTAIVLPNVALFEPLFIVREIARHLGGPEDATALRLWLAGNFVRFSEALDATRLAREADMIASLDMHYGVAVYELRRPFAACRALLDANAAVAPDALNPEERNEGFNDACAWFESDVPPEDAGGPRPALGRVLLGQTHWRIEAVGKEHLAVFRRAFEATLGNAVQFTGERIDDTGAAFLAAQPKADLTLVPPSLLEKPGRLAMAASRVELPTGKLIEDFMAAQQMTLARAFLDKPVPALDGKTPREAACDPRLRPCLLTLLRQRVRAHDEQNLRTGRHDDINWLLLELGTTEILFDAPPVRPNFDWDVAEDLPEDLTDGPARHKSAPVDKDDLTDPPPLPSQPFSTNEAEGRLGIAFRHFKSSEEAIRAMDDAGGLLLGDAEEMLGEVTTPEDRTMIVMSMLQVWFAFVPPGCRGPFTDDDDLLEAFEKNLLGLTNHGRESSPEELQRLMESGPQPNLVKLACLNLFELAESLPKKKRPNHGSLAGMAAFIKAAIDTLDAATRKEFGVQ